MHHYSLLVLQCETDLSPQPCHYTSSLPQLNMCCTYVGVGREGRKGGASTMPPYVISHCQHFQHVEGRRREGRSVSPQPCHPMGEGRGREYFCTLGWAFFSTMPPPLSTAHAYEWVGTLGNVAASTHMSMGALGNVAASTLCPWEP
jgi:hypothetical protein